MGARMTKLESLERLARLKESGVLTDEEFTSEKAKILAHDDPPLAAPQARPSAEPGPREPSSHDAAHDALMTVTTPKAAIELASRGWASVIALIAASVVGGIASIVALGEGRAPMLLSGTETAVFLGIAFIVNAALVILFGWLTARKHSLIGAWLLLLSSVGSLIFVLADDPMQDGFYVLFALVALSGMAAWYALQALRGVLALRRFSRQPGGRAAISSAKAAVEEERASQPRPTAREALAIGMETTRPVRRVMTFVGLMMMGGVVVAGALFWWLHIREPRTAVDLAVEQQRLEQEAAASFGGPQPPPPIQAATLQTSDLIGRWMSEDELPVTSCDEDREIRFEADSRYSNYGESGFWSLSGSALSLRVQFWEGFEGDGDPPYETVHMTVSRVSADRLLIQRAGQPPYAIVRCGS